MHYLCRKRTQATLPPLKVSVPSVQMDVRQPGMDPFFSGLAIGAAAAIVGMLVGFFLFLPA